MLKGWFASPTKRT